MSERGGCVGWDVVVQRVMVVCTGSRWSSPKVALLNRPNYYVIPQTVDPSWALYLCSLYDSLLYMLTNTATMHDADGSNGKRHDTSSLGQCTPLPRKIPAIHTSTPFLAFPWNVSDTPTPRWSCTTHKARARASTTIMPTVPT